MFKIIFMDYNLHGSTGPEISKKIYTYYDNQNVEFYPFIIACTGNIQAAAPPAPALSHASLSSPDLSFPQKQWGKNRTRGGV